MEKRMNEEIMKNKKKCWYKDKIDIVDKVDKMI